MKTPSAYLPAAAPVLAVLMFSLGASSAAEILFDFGAATSTPSLIDAKYWNNVGTDVAASDSGVLSGVVTSANQATGITLEMTSRFGGINTNGRTDSSIYPADVTAHSFYGNTETFSGLTNIFPVFSLAGLDPGVPYEFTLYASRNGVSDNRETQYTITGGGAAVVAALDPANNQDNVVTVSNIVPDANNKITLAIEPGPNNTNPNHFTYLGVLEVNSGTVVPEPSSSVLLLLGAGLLARRRRR